MATPVIMPMLGLTMEEGAVADWLKHEGDEVTKDEPLFTVEMDKGIVEVPAPASGILRRVSMPGQTVPVKTVIAEIAEPSEAVSEEVPPPPAASPGNQKLEPAAPATAVSSTLRGGGKRLLVSPRARTRARELGLALEGIVGSGPNGRIVEKDVLAFQASARAAAQVPGATARGLDLAAPPQTGPGERIIQQNVERATPEHRLAIATDVEVVALSRIRRITADRMAASARDVARVTLFLETDMTETAKFRAQLAPEFARLGVAKLPWDAIIAKAAGLALVENPALNAQWVEGQGIRRGQVANVGVAVALEVEGLVVPVLRDAGRRSLRALAGDLLQLSEKANAGRLAAEEMQGGSFTITNLGAYRIDGFTPIINPPETAILGVGRIAEKPAVVEGRIDLRQLCTLSLSFDHRVVDGAPAAAFLRRLAEFLERPFALLEI
ncbi:MAG: 2-oxo acid dehydrogenase subunit E2 [Chloroflexota bacterium]|nr:2-oxo acid dehydrogenase subunit E2 [Chloroflexota bacterium]